MKSTTYYFWRRRKSKGHFSVFTITHNLQEEIITARTIEKLKHLFDFKVVKK